MGTPQQPEPEKPQFDRLAFQAGQVFTPNSPVDEKSLFAGRTNEIRRIIDVVNQRGQHAIIYGERGVGKTSLANVLHDFLADMGKHFPAIVAPRVNCDGGDTFESIWRKVFDRIELMRDTPSVGYSAIPATTSYKANELFEGGPITPDSVSRVLTIMARDTLPILIIDEFDRLPHKPKRAFADTIKNLSDHAVGATVVIVGVADTVEHLLEEHQSIGRALVQIPMHRMRADEIGAIIDGGLQRLGMTIESAARSRILLLAQGLPHYAHLIGLHASRVALDQESLLVTVEMVNQAIAKAIGDAQQSIRTAYHAAVQSARKYNLFADVLLSCALAELDEMGSFAAQDVREPMCKITGKNYDIPSFAQHLNEFSDAKRGHILKKIGDARRYRFRFSDPLMQPYVVMHGMTDNKIPSGFLETMES